MLSFVELILALTCFLIVKVQFILLKIMFHARTKHIEIKYHYVRDEIKKGKLKVCKISTHNNPADMLTKPVPVAKFELCLSLVGKLKLSWY
jgi:hypothetical protein